MTLCEKCKWAKWNRTKTGRRHPSGQGRCTFEWTPSPLPAAFYFVGPTPLPSGGFINRAEGITQCHCFEQAVKSRLKSLMSSEQLDERSA